MKQCTSKLLFGMVLALTIVLSGFSISSAMDSTAEKIITKKDFYDGKQVTVKGTVSNLRAIESGDPRSAHMAHRSIMNAIDMLHHSPMGEMMGIRDDESMMMLHHLARTLERYLPDMLRSRRPTTTTTSSTTTTSKSSKAKDKAEE